MSMPTIEEVAPERKSDRRDIEYDCVRIVTQAMDLDL
jgi:hypothetical protein